MGEDRTEEAVKKFFTEEMGKRRCRTLRIVCMDMWAAPTWCERTPRRRFCSTDSKPSNTSMRRWIRFAARYGANSPVDVDDQVPGCLLHSCHFMRLQSRLLSDEHLHEHLDLGIHACRDDANRLRPTPFTFKCTFWREA